MLTHERVLLIEAAMPVWTLEGALLHMAPLKYGITAKHFSLVDCWWNISLWNCKFVLLTYIHIGLPSRSRSTCLINRHHNFPQPMEFVLINMLSTYSTLQRLHCFCFKPSHWISTQTPKWSQFHHSMFILTELEAGHCDITVYYRRTQHINNICEKGLNNGCRDQQSLFRNHGVFV